MNNNREKLVTVVSRTDVCMDKNEFKGPSLLAAGGQQVSRWKVLKLRNVISTLRVNAYSKPVFTISSAWSFIAILPFLLPCDLFLMFFNDYISSPRVGGVKAKLVELI